MYRTQDLETMLAQMSQKFHQTFPDESFTTLEATQPLSGNSQPKWNRMPADSQTQIQAADLAKDLQISHQQGFGIAAGENAGDIQLEQINNALESQNKCELLQLLHEKEQKEQITIGNQVRNTDQAEDETDNKRLLLDRDTDENDDLASYQSLTEQFEVALSKIKHKQLLNLNQTQFTSRQEDYQRKKATDINLLRAQKQRQIAKQCTAKPLINQRSQQLLLNHRPIHVRYQAVIEEKKKKIENLIAQKQAKLTQQEEQQLKRISQREQEIKKKLGGQIRSQQEYYRQMQRWAEGKRKKIEEQLQKQEEQVKQQSTFKPEINPSSQAIMKKYSSRVPIYEKSPVPKKAALDSNCTFKPNLNKTAKT